MPQSKGVQHGAPREVGLTSKTVTRTSHGGERTVMSTRSSTDIQGYKANWIALHKTTCQTLAIGATYLAETNISILTISYIIYHLTLLETTFMS